ncbi:MAG: hypothetical protein KF778_03545 [Rhodocyclaceae bacterium]|nr:hypothetical protein [Rhodocyclaceae bacterium]MBX3667453.1 hypothetical protein [Rhodocyclaceae bacterium]
MGRLLDCTMLWAENICYAGSGARSEENRASGFRPAFCDSATGVVYASCFADGRPAPFHLLDGLPDELVVARAPGGRVCAVKPSVVSGFVRERRFFTRDQAAAWMSEPALH